MPRVLQVRCLLAVAALLWLTPAAARADNAMGYRLLPEQEASALPRGHGSVGLSVQRAERIDDRSGLSFDLMRVTQVRADSAAARAGLRQGDEIIAVDGRVFPSLAAFAAYVGSLAPGQQMTVDTIPAGRGPQQAQRVAITVAGPGAPAPAGKSGLSTGTKLAIGAGAVALFGCYELGCFAHRTTQQPAVAPTSP